MIVAIDRNSKEVFRLQMKRAPKRKPKVKDPDDPSGEEFEVFEEEFHLIEDITGGFNGKPITIKSKFIPIETNSDDDDVTSLGGSQIGPSPMAYYGSNKTPFIGEFEGKPMQMLTPTNFGINKDDDS